MDSLDAADLTNRRAMPRAAGESFVRSRDERDGRIQGFEEDAEHSSVDPAGRSAGRVARAGVRVRWTRAAQGVAGANATPATDSRLQRQGDDASGQRVLEGRRPPLVPHPPAAVVRFAAHRIAHAIRLGPDRSLSPASAPASRGRN